MERHVQVAWYSFGKFEVYGSEKKLTLLLPKLDLATCKKHRIRLIRSLRAAYTSSSPMHCDAVLDVGARRWGAMCRWARPVWEN